MSLRHDCVEDDHIGHEAKTWKLLRERCQCLVTPTVVNLLAKLAQRQLKDSSSEERSFIIKFTRSKENFFRDPFKRLDPQWSANEF